jgi:hypothetical protein
MDQKKKSMGVFYDFSKAYDTVNHNILLQKLNNMGIAGVANDWVRSFLCNRRQAVHIRTQNGEVKSEEWKSGDIGLPQGSTLSPLLFLLFTNDMPSKVKEGSLTLFADDTTHFFTATKGEDVCAKANQGVKQMEEWSRKNELFLNKEKTLTMNFEARKCKKDSSPLIRLDKVSIEHCTDTKFLGIIIDSQLDWNKHVTNVAAKVASGCFLLKKLKNLVSTDILRLVYFANIQSHLMYGVIVWGNCTHTKRLFSLQKTSMRIMAKASRNPCADVFYKDSTKPLFRNFKIMTLPSIYMYCTILFVIDWAKQVDKDSEQKSSHNTRNKDNLKETAHHLELYKKEPLYAGRRLFNKLPNEIKSLRDKSNFKDKLKSFFIEKCFYSTKEFVV